MRDELEIVELEATPSLRIRFRTSNDRVQAAIDDAFLELLSHLATTGVEPCGPPYVACLSYDQEGSEIECGLPVAMVLEVTGRLEMGESPSGKAARAMHRGPRSRLMECYATMMRSLAETGEKRAGPTVERRLEENLTEVLWMLL